MFVVYVREPCCSDSSFACFSWITKLASIRVVVSYRAKYFLAKG
jgi:hypothetical protein